MLYSHNLRDSALAKKYYVVWKGRKTGIFDTWAQCQAQVNAFAGAKFKSFPTLAEAESAFGNKVGAASGSAPSSSSNLSSKPKSSSKPKKPKLTQVQIETMPLDVKIFTDGASEPNPGEAGSGIAIYQDNTLTELWYGIYQEMGTNNTAELNGLYQAMLIAKDKIKQNLSVGVFCDSMYSIQCITQWAAGWQKKGWVKAGGEIKNLDLIKQMFSLYQELEKHIEIHHVNGHVGIEGNELADRMSIIAIESKEQELSLYRETMDITEILASRRG